jgi:hypothetical protein
MRPLRLFVATDNLRWFRILVLKSTHFPFVAVIQIYEGLMEIVIGARSGRGPSESFKGPTSSASQRLGKRVGSTHLRSPMATPSGQAAQAENSRISLASGKFTGLASPSVTGNDEVQRMLHTLLARVDRLTALVEGKQVES